MRARTLFAALIALVSLGSGMSSVAVAVDLPDVVGAFGMTPVTERSYASVWIPVPEGQALAGVMWYNNDGQAVFPRVLAASGTADEPASAAGCAVVGEAVAGVSSGWSTVVLSEPIRSDRGGFYLLFQFPEGSVKTAAGTGGGAGLGYCAKGGCEGWMSVDGQDWIRVGRNYGFAVVPQFVAATPGMLSKSMAHSGDDTPTAEVFETAMLPAAPNPFNPATDIRFTLKTEGLVTVGIYDLRGRKVADLANEVYAAGEHTVRWEGRDRRGQRVPSGVYFVKMTTTGQLFTQRVMLIK